MPTNSSSTAGCSKAITSNQKTQKRPSNLEGNDHDYLPHKKQKTKSFKRHNENMNHYYQETIEVLKNIDKTMEKLNTNFEGIKVILDKKLTELIQSLKEHRK